MVKRKRHGGRRGRKIEREKTGKEEEEEKGGKREKCVHPMWLLVHQKLCTHTCCVCQQ